MKTLKVLFSALLISLTFTSCDVKSTDPIQDDFQDWVDSMDVAQAKEDSLFNLYLDSLDNVLENDTIINIDFTGVCGAKTKSGDFCTRKVSGGGKCWQH